MYYLRQFFETLLYPLRAILTSPGKVSSSARKLAAISLPARIAILVALLLILAAVVAYIAFIDDPEAANFWQDNKYLIPILIVVIPIVLYYVLRLWMEGDVSRYPDIDYAWKAGLAELRAHGLDLEYTPLFLVLGSPGDLQEKALLNAAQLPLRVRDVPTGAAALHWFAEPNGIYLVCTDVGCLSKLAALAKRAADEGKSQPVRTAAPAAAGDVRGTMVLDQDSEPAKPVTATQTFPAPAAAQSRPNIRGTIVVSQEQEDPIVPEVGRKQVLLPQETQREQELRLEYLCRLIAKARQPLAPVNGILTLLPYSIVQTGRREGSELQRTVHRDLSAVVRSLKLRCPVVSLVIGMEEESGFREMVRRLGREPAMAQRFGKGFSVGNPPIPEQLEAVASHACGLFEAKIYELFREKGSLSKPGNTKLYALLCKIRRTVRVPLTNILVNGYARDPDTKKDSDTEPLFFSGCYFAATGEADDRQAFVKAIFEKLPLEQEGLEWTEDALREDERYRRWSQVAMWIDGALLVSLAAMVLYKFWK
jgi:hypothetical protein